MKINKFTIRHNNENNNILIEFSEKMNIVYSRGNETGKTTLMRAILYTLGFAIPDTELIAFSDFEFSLEIINNKKRYIVTRNNKLLIINDNEYDLPMEQLSAHIFLFESGNSEIVSNILGAIYFDQEKGWTLLNRGTIIGENRFNIESLFRGLKGDESDDSYRLTAKISAIDKKITQYKLMANVSEYQESIERDVERTLDYNTYEQKIDKEMLALKIRLQKVEEEINTISEIIKKNKNFSDFIAAKKIYVKNPNDGPPIRVTNETLFGFIDTAEINNARKSKLIAERFKLKKDLFAKEQIMEKEEYLFDLPDVDEELTRKFLTAQNFTSVQAKIMLEKFQKERKELKNILNSRTKQGNEWADQAFNIIIAYAKELKIPINYKIDIFTSNLKSKSGVILHKMVFIYKLAYIKLLSKKLGYHLPIFIDSPSGREVEKANIDEMLKIINRDFSKHQVIIASIHKYPSIFLNPTIIQMDGTLFENTPLFV
jgi:hypothetical protein